MQGRFVFALQPLLEARKRAEDVKRCAFALMRETRDAGAREADRLVRALDAGGFALHACATAGHTAGLRLYDAHLRYLAAAIVSQRAQNATSQAGFERASAELVEANRERRLIEKLRERRLAEFEAQEARCDELEIDEANARLHSRPSTGSG